MCLDAGYVNPAICREIILNGHTPLMPYKSPMTSKEFFKNMSMLMMNIMTVIFVQIMKYYPILQQIKMDINNTNQILINVQIVHLRINVQKAKIIKK